MGTRSLTVFKDGKEEICVMYRQFDGYPEGHGKELAELLAGMKMVNGFGGEPKKQANGMPCLVAQVIAHFKKGVGGFYIHPPKTRDCCEEYVYFVSGKEGEEPTIKCKESGSSHYILNGKASTVLKKINKGV